MKTQRSIYCFVIFFSVCIYTPSFSQDKDVILVDGTPPLTQLMVGKTIVLLDWVLDLKLSKEQELKIKAIVVNEWKKNNIAAIKSTTDLIEVYEQVFKLSGSEQNKLKEKMQPAVLQNLYDQPADELSAFVIAAYESIHAVPPKRLPSSNMKTALQKNNQRVGKDEFTGIYRMVRPKALNMNSSSYERGFYIEYITFLPDGNLFWSLPPEGLLYFDPGTAQRVQPNNWGTYEFTNGEIHVLRGPAKKKYVITRTGDRLNNPPSLGKGSFRRVPPADGLQLDGIYRRNTNEPAISFTTDGKFTDEGIFRFFGTIGRLDGSTYMDDGVGGSGTYVIDQNTLELKYSDGRVKRHVFIVFPENLVARPMVKSFLLHEQRMERY